MQAIQLLQVMQKQIPGFQEQIIMVIQNLILYGENSILGNKQQELMAIHEPVLRVGNSQVKRI